MIEVPASQVDTQIKPRHSQAGKVRLREIKQHGQGHSPRPSSELPSSPPPNTKQCLTAHPETQLQTPPAPGPEDCTPMEAQGQAACAQCGQRHRLDLRDADRQLLLLHRCWGQAQPLPRASRLPSLLCTTRFSARRAFSPCSLEIRTGSFPGLFSTTSPILPGLSRLLPP